MIDDEVVELADDLVSQWNLATKEFIRYRLDFSWPTIGTIDLILHQFLGRSNYSQRAETLLLQSSAYIGGMAYDCWRSFPDKPEIKLYLDTTKSFPDIVLSARGGRHLKQDESYEIGLCSSLKNLLENPKRRMPIFADGIRSYIPEDRLVCSFTAGVCAGMSPYGIGEWKNISLQEFAPQLATVSRRLAQSSAKYFTETFPSTPEIGSEVLYYPHLCLPPAGYDEPFLGVRGASAVVDFMAHRKLTVEEAAKISVALASSADELISLSGIIAGVAISDFDVSPELLRHAEQRRVSMPALRKSIEIISKMYSDTPLLIEHLENGEIEVAFERFKKEQRLGLLPLAFGLSVREFQDPGTRSICQYVCLNDLQNSISLCELYLEGISINNRILLQLGYLYLTSGRADETEKLLAILESALNVSDEEDALRLELLGLHAEKTSQKSLAHDSFLLSAQKTEVEHTKARLYHWLAKNSANMEGISKALEYASNAKRENLTCPQIALAELVLLKEQISREDFSNKLKTLLRLHPNDRAIFLEYIAILD